MIKNISQNIVSEYNKYLRVWRILRKPTMSEFKTISKITAVGLLIIGAIGFAIALLVQSTIEPLVR